MLLYWKRILKDDLESDFIAIIVMDPTKIHKNLFLTGDLISSHHILNQLRVFVSQSRHKCSRDKTTPEKPLKEVIEYMTRYHLENLLVVNGDDNDKLAGVMDYSKAQRKISAEVLQRRKIAVGTTLAL